MSAYFSRKMVRLILILGPAAAICAGAFAAFVFEWSMSNIFNQQQVEIEKEEEEEEKKGADKAGTPQSKKGKKASKKDGKNSLLLTEQVMYIKKQIASIYNYNTGFRK
eukprot:7571006-Pyramimonas_sp.AAC.1